MGTVEGMGSGSAVRTRLTFMLALFLPALFLALPAAGDLNPLALAAGLAAALIVCVVHVRVEPDAARALVRTVSLRKQARLAEVLRLHDPGTPGSPRPRAPSLGTAAA
jgi:hypothetical protein